MQKNYSPRTIALFGASISFILVFVISYAVFNHILNCAIVATLVFIIVFATVWYYVQQIVDKKIRTIYKFINQTKASKRESFYNENLLPHPTLQDVSIDVENWANDNKAAFTLLEKNEQYRREFLQNLSHELKTPVFSIQGYVESLLDGALYNEEVNVRFLQNTSKSIDRLISLLHDLDEITSLENHQQQLTLSSFAINDLITEVYESLQIQTKENNIHLISNKNNTTHLKVWADKEKIRQVLTNLIVNAIKYGKQNGTITTTIELYDTKQLLIEITDDGSGIAQEHLNRIFERFYRTDMARERKIGGSGLGLAICKHIIEAHNQTIHVRSQIGVGSTFGFTMQRG